MTEEEWLDATNPQPMLEFLRGKTSDRKLRLFACGCYRLLPEEYTSKVLADVCTAVEKHVEGQIPSDEMNRLRQDKLQAFFMTEAMRSENKIRQLLLSARRLLWQSAQESSALVVRLRCMATFGDYRPELIESTTRQKAHDRKAVACLVADIFGNPFRTNAAESSWLTSDVLALAHQMYESQDFSPMPILADALQDASCDSNDILNHCRQPGEHVRGCWALDLVLGKS